MLKIDSDILEIKFEGNDIAPQELTVAELIKEIKLFHDLILPIIREQNPGIEIEADYVTLQDLGNRSLSLRHFIKRHRSLVISAFTSLLLAIEAKEISSLPPRTIEALERTADFNARHGTTSSFGQVKGGNFNAIVSFRDEFKAEKIPTIKGKTVVYGLTKSIFGGSHPSAKLVLSNNSEIRLGLTIEQAQKLVVDTHIRVEGIGTWKGLGLKLTSVDASSIDLYEKLGIGATFELLAKQFGESWKGIDPTKYLH